jgi:hypothetical protein
MSTQDRAPAFQFYAKDWLAEPKVRGLSWDNRGRYIDLLASMWTFSDDHFRIPRATAERMYGRRFVALIADGPHALVISEEYEGLVWLSSMRLYEEALKVRAWSAAGRRGAQVKWERWRAGLNDASN